MMHQCKILLFDLETFGFNFNADAGFIMVASYKWFGEDKVHTITRDNPNEWTKTAANDKKICKEFAKIIEQADMVAGWNSRSFDWRFLQTRMLKHKLGILPPVPHWDGLNEARRSLKMRRSLENVGKFFGLETQKEKMDLAEVWMPAGAGDPKALKQVIKRCESDVLLLEEAYKLLAPLSKIHPNVSDSDAKCPICASPKLQHRGEIKALRHHRKRFHCQDCGKWSTSQPIKYGKAGI